MNAFTKSGAYRLFAVLLLTVTFLLTTLLFNHLDKSQPARPSIEEQDKSNSFTALTSQEVASSAADVIEITSQSEKLSHSGVDYSLLQMLLNRIKFDDQGNLLLEASARQQLDAAVTQMGFARSGYELANLENAIAEYLPGAKGRQVSDLLARYYQYKVAEHDYLSGRDLSFVNDSSVTYNSLRELRKSYLSDELSSKLFSQEDQYMDYTFAIMAVDKDETLSQEQRAQRLDTLQKNYALATGAAGK